jgi:Cu-Zn family superoxide dismutase
MRLVLALVITIVAGAGVGAAAVLGQGRDGGAPLEVELRDATGEVAGVVELRSTRFGTTDVTARTRRGLRSGWHGFHVHETGRCEGPSFASAGGHLKAAGQEHRDHAGDLAPLLVKLNGSALGRVTTDRFAVADLQDADGSALIVHSVPTTSPTSRPGTPPAGRTRRRGTPATAVAAPSAASCRPSVGSALAWPTTETPTSARTPRRPGRRAGLPRDAGRRRRRRDREGRLPRQLRARRRAVGGAVAVGAGGRGPAPDLGEPRAAG